MSNIQESLFFSQKGQKNGQNLQNDNFPKKWVGVNLYSLMVSNIVQNIKKIKWVNFEQYTKKDDFVQLLCPFLLLFAIFQGKKAFFQKNYNIILNVLWYSIFMQKNYWKHLNGSKDIVIWKIERSDCLRAFAHKSR